jgi:hypothetical protein
VPSRDFLVNDPDITRQLDQRAAVSREEAVEQFIVREHISGFDGVTQEWVIIRDCKREGGIATARAIPDAELHVFADMRHQLRPDLWPDYARIVRRNAARTDA